MATPPRVRLKEPTAPKLPASLGAADLPGGALRDDDAYLSMAFGTEDLSGQAAEQVEFDRCRFDGTSLATASLPGARLSDVVFADCDLANLSLPGAVVTTTSVSRSRLTGSRWTDCALHDMTFADCRIDLAHFRLSQLKNVVFRDCVLTEASFQSADLTNVRFENCRMTAAQFSGATLKNTQFAGCDLQGLGGVQNLRGAIVNAADAQSLLYTLTSALGITVEDHATGPGR